MIQREECKIFIKICGLKRKEDIDYVNELCPDFVGFVFDKSKREVTAGKAEELIKILNKSIKTVGVFVDKPLKEIIEIIDKMRINVIQLHGNESEDYIKELKRITGKRDIEIWKAISVSNKIDLKKIHMCSADKILLDNGKGGTGECFSWELIENRTIENKLIGKKIVLAGGLNITNIKRAVERINPCIVDVSSGVETEGIKDFNKIKEFIGICKVTERRKTVENNNGRFGKFGGQYVPEILMRALIELENEYMKASKDKEFIDEYKYYLREYSGRETPLYFAKNLTLKLGGAKIYLKREDLNHTGAHKINNALGQVLLAKRMGKRKIIAETGAGQHGIATATVAAMFNMECEIFMGEEDILRQQLNVTRMNMLGAKVTPVKSGTSTLKDATNEAMRRWVENVDTTYYVVGSVVGPHPYPTMVRNFQKVIGDETKAQILEKEGRLPNYIVACVGGGSNAIGMFYQFIEDKAVKLIGVEAAGLGVETDKHAATLSKGSLGVIHGMMTYLLQDDDGQIMNVYSISAGLDYPGIGPEHASLRETGRAKYFAIKDNEAIEAFMMLCRTEGIIPAIESSHAIAEVMKLAPKLPKDEIIVVNLSGRGDKDVDAVEKYLKNFSNIEVEYE